MRNCLSFLPAVLICCLAATAPAQIRQQQSTSLPPGMKEYESKYYRVFTDISPDSAREAVIRMTKMAEVYHDRTASFTGVIREKLPFYLFNTSKEYFDAGGMVGSAGVFNGSRLMAMAMKDHEGRIAHPTWHIVQHEGFHQFVHAVIQGDIPTWTNEGLAEYFGEGIFTGDGFVTGIVPPARLARVKKEIEEKKYKPFPEIMLLDLASWNREVAAGKDALVNYDQAWSMVHFLAHADNGKYQEAFSAFMFDVGRGRPWEEAWTRNFGSAVGFEEKWKDFWSAQSENPTANLYAQAVVATMTSFVGRAYTQKQGFDNFDELAGTDPKSLKTADADWLPPGLFTEQLGVASQLKEMGYQFAITRDLPRSKLPQVACTLDDGSKLVGRFTMRGTLIGDVKVDTVPAPKGVSKAGGKTGK